MISCIYKEDILLVLCDLSVFSVVILLTAKKITEDTEITGKQEYDNTC